MAISKLRKQLRQAGIKDENMHFDDAADGGIIPRLVLDSREVVVYQENHPQVSTLPAEKCDPSDSRGSYVPESGR
jgi:hypothetical protein